MNRTLAVLEMLKSNQTIHTLEFSDGAVDEQLFRSKINPRLMMNLFRPRVDAISKEVGMPHRRRLLSAALTP